MDSRFTIHLLDPDSRVRARLSHMAFDLGHHAEVYASSEELLEHPPREGVLVARDGAEGSIEMLLRGLAQAGVWLPLVAMDEAPAISSIVAAIKAGALDYLALPLDIGRFGAALARISDEAREQAEARRRMIDARSRIANLSTREREVLDWLTEGSSNKAIARALEISPRTVEIHRANMMAKLGARHPADAVRLKFEAAAGG